MQLHGFVVDKSIERKPDTLEYRFRIESNGKVVQAHYTGIVPDTFKHGSEVVLKGTLGPDGFTVSPNGVMAKCPSKYEPGKRRSPDSGYQGLVAFDENRRPRQRAAARLFE